MSILQNPWIITIVGGLIVLVVGTWFYDRYLKTKQSTGRQPTSRKGAAVLIDGGHKNKFVNSAISGGLEIRDGNRNEFTDTDINR